MKLLTWNVNGLASVVRKQGSLKLFLEECCQGADIICLQETKLNSLSSEYANVAGWESFWNCCQPGVGPATGYSGVATFCRSHVLPVSAQPGLTGLAADCSGVASAQCAGLLSHQLCQDLGFTLQDLETLDSEGRALITDHGLFVLVNLYGPAITIEDRAEERLAFKLNFYKVLEWRIRRWVSEGRAVVVVGDLNISPHPIDTCKLRSGFMDRLDRQWLLQLLGDTAVGLTDVFRHFHPTRENAYTCWNTASGARINNYGSRIDHILFAAGPQQLTASLQHTPQGPQKAQGSPEAAFQAQPTGAAAAQLQPAQLFSLITDCDIAVEQQGSDHAPVWATLAIPPELLPAGHAPPAGAASRIFSGTQTTLESFFQIQHQSQVQVQQPRQLEQEGLGAAAGLQHNAAPPAVHSSSSNSTSSSSKRAAASLSSSSAQGGAASKRSRAGARAAPGKSAAAGGQASIQRFFSMPSPATAGDAQQPHQQHHAGLLQTQTSLPATCQQVTPAQQHATTAQCSAMQLPSALSTPAAGAAAAAAPAFPLVRAAGREHQQQQQQQQGQQHAEPYPAPHQPQQQVLEAHEQATKAAWQRIHNSMKPPLCRGHKEPCVIRTVKRKGVNVGRQFWACARPDGPFPGPGQCKHFEFASGPKKLKGASGAAAAAGSKVS